MTPHEGWEDPSGQGDRARALMAEAERAYDAGDLRGAAARAREAVDLLEACGSEADGVAEDLVEAWYLIAWACMAAMRLEDARDAVARLLDVSPGNPKATYVRIWIRFNEWDFEEAEQLLEDWDPPEDLKARVTYLRAVLAEFNGRPWEGERLYRAAHELDPETFIRPFRMAMTEVRDLVSRTMASLPADIAEAVAHVEIVVDELPNRDRDKHGHTPPEMLGYYHGINVADKSVFREFPMVDRIRIFKRNIERCSADWREAKQRLRITLLHEIGHHLGLDEEGLEKLGLR